MEISGFHIGARPVGYTTHAPGICGRRGRSPAVRPVGLAAEVEATPLPDVPFLGCGSVSQD